MLIPFVVPVVDRIIASRRVNYVSLGIGVGMRTGIAVLTITAFALAGWFIGFHALTGFHMSWGVPGPYLAPPLVFGVAGAIPAGRLIWMLNDRIPAGSVVAYYKAEG